MMQGLKEHPLKPARTRKNPLELEGGDVKTATSLGGAGASISIFLPGEKSIKYTDPDGRSGEDEETARDMLYKAVAFIQENATTDEEKAVAAKLTDMMNNKKIQLDNILGRKGDTL